MGIADIYHWRIIALLGIVAGFCSCAYPVPNLLLPDVYTLIAPNGQNVSLKVTCLGDKHLYWKTKIDSDYYEVKNTLDGDTHKSVFMIPDPYPEDSGELTCHYGGMDDGKADTSFVYIYDNKTVFIGQDYDGAMIGTGSPVVLSFKIGDEIVLDCRTSHPSFVVSVFRDGHKGINKDEETPSKNVTHLFNEKFNTFRMQAKSLHDSGGYSCRATVPNGEEYLLPNPEEPPIIKFFIDLVPNTSVQKPSITASKNTYFVVGYDFVLGCLMFPSAMMKTTVLWEIPTSVQDKKKYNVTEMIEFVERFNSTRSTTYLKVFNASLEDSGPYYCNIMKGDATNHEIKNVEILPYIDPFINFTYNLAKPIKLPVGEPVRVVLIVKAFPEKGLEYYFTDTYGAKIISDGKHITTNFTYLDGKLLFKNNNPTQKDFGRYEAVVHSTTYGIKNTTSFKLYFYGKPLIEMDELPAYFEIGNIQQISTSIYSYGGRDDVVPPDVTWEWGEGCRIQSNCEFTNMLEIVPFELIQSTPENHFRSTLNLQYTTSGLLKGTVANINGTSIKTAQIIVSDISSRFIFEFQRYSERYDARQNNSFKIIEGEHVKLRCAALNYLYTDLKLDIKGLPTFDCSTDLATAFCIDILSVDMNFTGEYTCSGMKYTGEYLFAEVQTIDVLVEGQIMPSLLLEKSNVSIDGTATYRIENSKSFILACYVEGRPRPTITWYLNDDKITSIPRFDDAKMQILDDGQLLEVKFALGVDSGIYSCHISSRLGEVAPSAEVMVKEKGLDVYVWVIIGFGIVFLIALIIAVVYLVSRIKEEKRYRKQLRANKMFLFGVGKLGDLNADCTADEQAELLPYDKEFEVDKERIKLGKQLGSGAFGRVMLGEVFGLNEKEGVTKKVAVKMCKESTDPSHLRALTLELKIMIHLGKHLNIVNLVGAYTTKIEKGELWLLVEYCRYGNLQKFMHKHRHRFVNQIDESTGRIDGFKLTQDSNDPVSPGRVSLSVSTTTDSDGYLQTRSKTPIDGQVFKYPSVDMNPGLDANVGFYAANPNYATQTPQVPSRADRISESGYVPATYNPIKNSSGSSSGDGNIMNISDNFDSGMGGPPTSSEPTVQGNAAFPFDNFKPTPGVHGPFTTTDLVSWAWQVANGMDYLIRRKILHGDLATRNLLLAENNIVKISDFGMSRDLYQKDIYVKQGDEIMPIKWMALEAIQQRIFSTQSDIWAYGVTIWEIFTLGNTPYPGVDMNRSFLDALIRGERLTKPKFCNEELYDLMMRTWRADPLERPHFDQIQDILFSMLNPETQKDYMAMNDFFENQNEEWFSNKTDYLQMVASPNYGNIANVVEETDELSPGYSRGMSMEPVPAMRDSNGSDPEKGEADSGNVDGYLPMDVIRSGTNESTHKLFTPKTNEGTQKFDFVGSSSPKIGSKSSIPTSPHETVTLLPSSVIENEKNEELSAKLRLHNNNIINESKPFDPETPSQHEYKNLAEISGPNKNDANLYINATELKSLNNPISNDDRPEYCNLGSF